MSLTAAADSLVSLLDRAGRVQHVRYRKDQPRWPQGTPELGGQWREQGAGLVSQIGGAFAKGLSESARRQILDALDDEELNGVARAVLGKFDAGKVSRRQVVDRLARHGLRDRGKLSAPRGFAEVDVQTQRKEAAERLKSSLSSVPEGQRGRVERLGSRLLDEVFTGEGSVFRSGDATVSVAGDVGDVSQEDVGATADELARLTAAFPDVGPVSVSVVSRSSMGRLGGERTAGIALPSDLTGGASVFVLHEGAFRHVPEQGDMPAHRGVSEAEWTVAHEFGHLLERRARESHSDLHSEHSHSDHEHGLSAYGQESEEEGFAEAFAEWWVSGGRTQNAAARAYAERFGWPVPSQRSPVVSFTRARRKGSSTAYVDPMPGVPNVRPENVDYWQKVLGRAYPGMPITAQMRMAARRFDARRDGKWPKDTPVLGGRFFAKGKELVGQVAQALGKAPSREDRAKVLSLLDDRELAAVLRYSGLKLPRGSSRDDAERALAAGFDPDKVKRPAADIPEGTRTADAVAKIPENPFDPESAPRQRAELLRGLSVDELRAVADELRIKVPRHPLVALRDRYGDWRDEGVIESMPPDALQTLALELGLPAVEVDDDGRISRRALRKLRADLVEAVKGKEIPDDFDRDVLAQFIARSFQPPPKPRAPRKPPTTPEERVKALEELRSSRGDWRKDPSVVDGMKGQELRLVAADLGVRTTGTVPVLRARVRRAIDHQDRTGFRPGHWEQVDPAQLREEAQAKAQEALAKLPRGTMHDRRVARQTEKQLQRLIDELFPEEPYGRDVVVRNGPYTVTVRDGTRDVDVDEVLATVESLVSTYPDSGPVSVTVIPDRRMDRYEGADVLGFVQPSASAAGISAMVLSDDLWARPHEKPRRGHFMGASRRASRGRYTVTHEFGHLLAPDDLGEIDRTGLSRYGHTNDDEAVAEAFAEWHLTGGTTRNAATRRIAERYGWDGAPGTEPPPEPPRPRKTAKKAAAAPAKQTPPKASTPNASSVINRVIGKPFRIGGEGPFWLASVNRNADGSVTLQVLDRPDADGSRAVRLEPADFGSVEVVKPPRKRRTAKTAETKFDRAPTGQKALGMVPLRISGQVDEGTTREGFDVPPFASQEEAAKAAEAVEGYRSRGYLAVNAHKRGVPAPTPGEFTDAQVEAMEDGIDSALSRSHLTGDVVVWRGLATGRSVFGPRGDWPDDLTGFEWTDPAYVSTTASEGTAATFGEVGVMLRILLPEGTPALQLSGAEYESELLLGSGYTLRVVADHGVGGPVAGARLLDVEIVPAEVGRGGQ